MLVERGPPTESEFLQSGDDVGELSLGRGHSRVGHTSDTISSEPVPSSEAAALSHLQLGITTAGFRKKAAKAVPVPIGTVVWAKLQGFPWWPGLAAQERSVTQQTLAMHAQGYTFIYFFGAGDLPATGRGARARRNGRATRRRRSRT